MTMELRMTQYDVGDRVKFVGCSKEQINWGGNDDPKRLLREDNIYIINKIEAHTYHTKLMLEGVKGRFNSVCFIPMDKPNYGLVKAPRSKK